MQLFQDIFNNKCYIVGEKDASSNFPEGRADTKLINGL